MALNKRPENYVRKVLNELEVLRRAVLYQFPGTEKNSSECKWYMIQIENAKLCLENMLETGDD